MTKTEIAARIAKRMIIYVALGKGNESQLDAFLEVLCSIPRCARPALNCTSLGDHGHSLESDIHGSKLSWRRFASCTEEKLEKARLNRYITNQESRLSYEVAADPDGDISGYFSPVRADVPTVSLESFDLRI